MMNRMKILPLQVRLAVCNSCKFTLIELLVVISIIAVLAGMLLPALTQTKETVTTLMCGSKVKDVNLVVLSYSHDYNDRCPTVAFNYDAAQPPSFPIVMAREKRLNKKMVTCTVKDPSGANHGIDLESNKTLIGINKSMSGALLSKVKKPSLRLLTGECCWDGNKPIKDTWGRFTPHSTYFSSGAAWNGSLAIRHDRWRSVNVVHVDGHLQKITLPYAILQREDLYIIFGRNYLGGKLGTF